MKNPMTALKSFTSRLGLVEQAQVVSSTAVVVAMVTIVGAYFFSGRALSRYELISIITVGSIGYLSVYFSLKYGRQLEEQRRELVALNTIAAEVTRSVELEVILPTTLRKIVDLLGVEFGWIYLARGDSLQLRYTKGTNQEFIDDRYKISADPEVWVKQPQVRREKLQEKLGHISERWKEEGIRSWASIPLESKGTYAGTLIVASKNYNMFTPRQVQLMDAFGHQISVALHNATLFDQLRKSKELYSDLYENAPDMYHSVDRNGTIVSCNQTEAERLGYEKRELVGQPIFKIYPPDYHGQLRQVLHRIFDTGEELKGVEEQMLRKEGSLIDVSVSTTIVFDHEGKPKLTRTVARDITEKKKLEQKILQAQKIDSIGGLAGGVAHDFNNILSSILGSASIMRRRMGPKEKLYKYVGMIEAASRRGAALTRQLLTFARKHNVHVRPVDVHSILDDTLRMFERSVSKNVVIKKSLTRDIAIMNADEGQLQQAFLNLLINARDAMPEGGTLTVETELADLDENMAAHYEQGKPGMYLMVTIKDIGVGMEPRVLQKIFEPFFTTKESGKGTGLGLSVVHGVVHGHGGFIHVESRENVGSTFILFLPRLTSEKRIRREPPHQKLRGGVETILLIDDEPPICEIASDMLTGLGYRVIVAEDGKKGVSLYRKKKSRIDLVILDLNMPEMDGHETLRRLKMADPKLPVLISSGYGDGALDIDASNGQIEGFLQKPYQVEDIARVVREVLDRLRKS